MKTKTEYAIGIVAAGIADTKTGSWRSQRPVVDKSACVNCGLCLPYCPVGIISEQSGSASINYEYCKGCGICATVCPKQAINMREEG